MPVVVGYFARGAAAADSGRAGLDSFRFILFLGESQILMEGFVIKGRPIRTL